MGQETLGQFEHYVMLAILRLGQGAFTAPIVEELEARTGRTVAPAAVYITLRRLEKRSLVRSKLKVDDSAGAKRERRFVVLTPHGIDVLHRAREEFARLWEGIPTGVRRGRGDA